MNLHDIPFGNTFALIWATVQGGNGRPLGRDTGDAHLFQVERENPPPIDTNSRTYWYPWRLDSTITDPRRPLCGVIRTQARWYAFGYTSDWTPKCPACRALAERRPEDKGLLHAIQERDPWYVVPRAERRNTPDPLTGL